MIYRKFALGLALVLVSSGTIAGVKVAGLDLTVKGEKGKFTIVTEGHSNELPDIKVTGRTIEVSLGKADAFTAIEKKILGAELSAAQQGGRARIVAVLPYDVSAEALDLGLKSNRIEINFPRGRGQKIAAPEQGISPKEIAPTRPEAPEQKKISKESLNEDYLKTLMNEGTEPAPKTAKARKKTEQKDEVKVTQAAPAVVSGTKPAGSDSFSFAGYAAKFTVFLALVLGLFYGIVQLLKRGVFSRGKLGFLNNTQLIQVLSTTYVAPKRALLVVRAHKQIFLVGSSESGLTFLAEMADTTGLIKEGEKFVTGTNFDQNLTEAASAELIERFKLKENILESAPLPPETGIEKLASAKDDIVKFSEELKKKAKKLRPIENRVN